MKGTKAKSYHGFKVLIWSQKYYKETKGQVKNLKAFEGQAHNIKSGEKKFFHTAGELLRFLEMEYKKMEKK